MGKGDKKSRRGKIIMGSWGVSRPRRKKGTYKFIPRGKKESAAAISGKAEKASPATVAEVSALEQSVKPKKKTATTTTIVVPTTSCRLGHETFFVSLLTSE